MKRILSLIIVFILVVSMAVVPAFGFSDDSIRLYRKNFTDKYVQPYDAADGYYFYFEQYYHYVDENDPDSDIDWVLVYAGDMSYVDGKIKQVVGDRVFYADEASSPFAFKYAVYDVDEDVFYELSDELLDKYDGLLEALRVENPGVMLGDADMDKELSVLDATQIQLVVAQLDEFDAMDSLDDYAELGTGFTYISDFNRDGVRDILDATGIQLYLAQVEVEEPVDPDGMM